MSPAAGVEYSSLYYIRRSKVSSPGERLVHCYWSSRMRRPIVKVRKLMFCRFNGFVTEMKQCLVLAELECGLNYLGCLPVATRNCIEFQNYPSRSALIGIRLYLSGSAVLDKTLFQSRILSVKNACRIGSGLNYISAEHRF